MKDKKKSEGLIIASPTLVKQLPLPQHRIIGDLSNLNKFLVGLDLNMCKQGQ
jgi:circadian clock protein KaiB